MRILAPICRVTVGSDVWVSGDGRLKQASVEIGEDDRSNSCQFALHDPGLLIADRYFALSFEKGGIEVPPDLLQAPKPSQPASTGSSAAATPGAARAASVGVPSIDAAFAGGSQSLIARAVGTSEGNRTPEGGFTGSYSGHTDPGNAAHNMGSFSVQNAPVSSPEEADAYWLNRLQGEMPGYIEACKKANLDPTDARLLTNFADLYTQAPEAATAPGGLLDQLPAIAAAGGGYDAILEARMKSYINPATGQLDAGGFGNDPNRLRADQRRRMDALESVVAKETSLTAIPPAGAPTTPATPAATATGTTPAAANTPATPSTGVPSDSVAARLTSQSDAAIKQLPSLPDTTRQSWINRYGTRYPEVPQADLVQSGAYQINKEAAEPLSRMIAAARSAGLNLYIISGFRSYSDQVQNLTEKRNSGRTWEDILQTNSPPGFSEHHTGFAFDFNSTDVSFENTPEFAWMKQHASEYGFVMSYTGTTGGATYEPWHWRYQAGLDKLMAGLNNPAPVSAASGTAGQPSMQDASTAKPLEVSKKGTEIIIELGYDLNEMVAFHFIHIGTNAQGRSLDTTRFDGLGIRYLLSRRRENTSYEQVSLKQLASIVAKKHNLKLEMEGDGVYYQHVDQSGISDYELLLREAKAIGFVVREEKDKLIIKPMRPEFTLFLIDEFLASEFTFNDRATNDRVVPPPSSMNAQSVPKTAADAAKAALDKATGAITQANPEDKTGTGNSAPSASTTGANTAPVSGNTTQPATDLGQMSDAVLRSRSGEQAAQPQKTPLQVLQEAASNGAPLGTLFSDNNLSVNIEEMNAVIEAGRAAENKPEASSDTATPATAAQAQAANYDIGRGYESSVSFKTIPSALNLKPGDVIGISDLVVPKAFAREWRINKVKHALQNGKLVTTLDIYSPVAIKKDAGGGGASTPPPAPSGSNSTLSGPATSSGWALPMALEGNSVAGDRCEFGYARGRLHAGLDVGGYGAGGDPDGVFAASDGTVEFADWAGGYGRCLDLRRADGWMSRYAHLASFDVSVGQQIKQGTRVGTRGSSGAGGDGSFDIHLHFEIRNPTDEPLNPRDLLPSPQYPKV